MRSVSSPSLNTVISDDGLYVIVQIAVRDPKFHPETMLDFGSGLGTAVWYVNHRKIQCFCHTLYARNINLVYIKPGDVPDKLCIFPADES